MGWHLRHPFSDGHRVGRRKLKNSCKHRFRGVIQHAPCEIVHEACVIGFGSHARINKQGLYFGGKEEGAPRHGVIEGFYSKSVPGTEEDVFSLVVDGEGPHAIEPVDAFRSPFLIGMEHHLAVCLRAESMANADKLLSEFGEVIYLSVEDQPERFIFIGHGLPREVR